MENLWPIAVGLSILGLIWAVVMNAKFNADREEQRRLNALDAAQAGNPNANAQITVDKAAHFLTFLEGQQPHKEPEVDSNSEPYELRTEAS